MPAWCITQNTRTWPGPVPIQVVNQPTDAFIVGQLPDVTNIRYFASGNAGDQVSSAAFIATIDLQNATIDPTQAVHGDGQAPVARTRSTSSTTRLARSSSASTRSSRAPCR